MPSLRRMSGQDVIAIFRSLGFEIHSQCGSHVKLRRTGPTGERETLTIPNHSELDAGTLCAIIRQSIRYVSPGILQRYLCKQYGRENEYHGWSHEMYVLIERMAETTAMYEERTLPSR